MNICDDDFHLAHWMRKAADVRVHGTTGEAPIDRFERDERQRLQPLTAKAPFVQVREYSRRGNSDACGEVDSCRYSVPWRLIGETVTVLVADGEVRIEAAGEQVACHAQTSLRRSAVIDRSHLSGVVGGNGAGVTWLPRQAPAIPAMPVTPLSGELLRPLTEYEAALGGTW